MPKRVLLSGNEAVATALRQINPDVFPAFRHNGSKRQWLDSNLC